jgi:myo-inositol-1(or 4)-monophosphatase
MDFNRIIELVQSTRNIILERSSMEVREKGPADFVTRIDLSVQEYLIKELDRLHPHIQVMAEEKENEIDASKPFWILDPIDGTTNLVHDYRHSAVSLALHEAGKIRFGIVYNPFSGETFHAEEGKGAFLNGERIRVSGGKELGRSLIMVGTASYYKHIKDLVFEEIFRVYSSCSDIRRTGAAALDLAYVACGRVEGFFERSLKPWDVAAGMLLIREAGGKVSGYSGEELKLERLVDIVADNGGIHEEFLRAIKG